MKFAATVAGILVVATLAGSAGSVSARDEAVVGTIRTSCPSFASGDDFRFIEIDSAIAAARQVVVRGRDTVQGRTERRTNANTPVLQAVHLTEARTRQRVADVQSLRRLGASRCGRLTAHHSWAVVFHQANSVLCCEAITVFVTRTKRGTHVY